MKKIILFSVLVLCGVRAIAQNQYAISRIDLTDKANSKLIPPNTDNLATILIDGYLNGKIRGYNFSYGSEVIKWTLPRLNFLPQPGNWEKGRKYLVEDQVSFANNAYRAIVDQPNDYQSPDQNLNEWIDDGPVFSKEPLSTKYFFPSMKDTLSRRMFLMNMSRLENQWVEAETMGGWKNDINYFAGDKVIIGYKVYLALRDSRGRDPEKDQQYWEYEGPLETLSFSRTMEVNQLTLLQKFSVFKNDTLFSTQIISLVRLDKLTGYSVPVLHFYYEDVINYLNEITSPLIYNSGLGYVGKSTFILSGFSYYSPNTSSELQNWLKTQFQNGRLKLNKNMVLNSLLYEKWLKSDTIKSIEEWNIFQMLKTTNIVISKVTSTNNIIKLKPFASIPVALIEKILNKSVPQLMSYSEAIQRNLFSAKKEIRIDSLLPRIGEIPTLPRTKKNYFFLEEYRADVDSANYQIKNLLPRVWQIVNHAFYERKLTLISRDQSYFPCRYDWSKLGEFNPGGRYTYTLGKNDPALAQSDPLLDSIASPKKFTDISVTYRKPFSQKKITKDRAFEAVKITLEFFPIDGEYTINYTFNWGQLKKLLLEKSPIEFKLFIEHIENGDLDFGRSQVIYGLMEEN